LQLLLLTVPGGVRLSYTDEFCHASQCLPQNAVICSLSMAAHSSFQGFHPICLVVLA